MPRSVGYNSIAGWQILCFSAKYYERNFKKKPNRQKKKKAEDLLQLHFNYDWSRRNKYQC